MKPLWTQTLVWLAAVAAALVLALLSPEPVDLPFDELPKTPAR